MINMKILEPHDGDMFDGDGYKTLDTHLHTTLSHDIPNFMENADPMKLYGSMMNRGFDYAIFSDHLSKSKHLEGVKEFWKTKGVYLDNLILSGELSLRPKKLDDITRTPELHFNVCDLSIEQLEDAFALAYEGDLYGFLDYARNEDIPHVYNHGVWFRKRDHKKKRVDRRIFPLVADEMDVLEINGACTREQNDMIIRYAQENNKGLVSGSDNHTGVPVMGTFAKGGDFREMWDRIKYGDSVLVRNDYTFSKMLEEVDEWLGGLMYATNEQLINNALTDNFRCVGGIMRFLGKHPILKDNLIGGMRKLIKAKAGKILDKHYLKVHREIEEKLDRTYPS